MLRRILTSSSMCGKVSANRGQKQKTCCWEKRRYSLRIIAVGRSARLSSLAGKAMSGCQVVGSGGVHGLCTLSTWALYSEYKNVELAVHGLCTALVSLPWLRRGID